MGRHDSRSTDNRILKRQCFRSGGRSATDPAGQLSESAIIIPGHQTLAHARTIHHLQNMASCPSVSTSNGHTCAIPRITPCAANFYFLLLLVCACLCSHQSQLHYDRSTSSGRHSTESVTSVGIFSCQWGRFGASHDLFNTWYVCLPTIAIFVLLVFHQHRCTGPSTPVQPKRSAFEIKSTHRHTTPSKKTHVIPLFSFIKTRQFNGR